MNENNIPVTFEASVITSVSQSTNTNDIIDLTEMNDGDECEVTSSYSVIVPNNSVDPQQPERPPRNKRRTNSSKPRSESADDSICILYENIQPPPEIQVVNEVVIDGREQNQSADINLLSIPVSPVVMGTYTGDPLSDFQQIPPLFPEISSESTSSLYQPINYSMDNHTSTSLHSTLPSCKYASVINQRPSQPFIMPHLEFQRTLPSTEVPLNLKTVSSNLPSHGSELEKANIVTKIPKIQCGICLDGPDEIAASDRNFTSTNCGHVFCNTCIKTSMRNQAKCPKCRKKITARSIHPLYF